MRKYLVIYEEASSHIWLCNRSLPDFLVYEEKNFLSFLSVYQVNVTTYKKYMYIISTEPIKILDLKKSLVRAHLTTLCKISYKRTGWANCWVGTVGCDVQCRIFLGSSSGMALHIYMYWHFKISSLGGPGASLSFNIYFTFLLSTCFTSLHIICTIYFCLVELL